MEILNGIAIAFLVGGIVLIYLAGLEAQKDLEKAMKPKDNAEAIRKIFNRN